MLAGKPLRYLIGASKPGHGSPDEVTVSSYWAAPVIDGVGVGYCNLFDEENTGRFGPYLHDSDTAQQYDEGEIDPRGPGWEKNLREQFERRRRQGFEYIELDNPDAYMVADVIGAVELAATYGLKVIAKNPGLFEHGAAAYVGHSNIFGIIVEKDAGTPAAMDALRREIKKPDLPVWFVGHGRGKLWANLTAVDARKFKNMGVTYSTHGEYGNSVDILRPVT
jgi:hypothetical protein